MILCLKLWRRASVAAEGMAEGFIELPWVEGGLDLQCVCLRCAYTSSRALMIQFFIWALSPTLAAWLTRLHHPKGGGECIAGDWKWWV